MPISNVMDNFKRYNNIEGSSKIVRTLVAFRPKFILLHVILLHRFFEYYNFL